MDSSQPPLQQPSQLFMPLMLSTFAVMFTALLLAMYHYVFSRYCGHRRDSHTRERQQQIINNMTSTGVEEKVLECIPILPYSSKQEEVFRVDQSECVVCLVEFEEGVVLRLLPTCGHAFHVKCIDEWFLCHSNCPVCRFPIVSPVSLPVQTPMGIEGGDIGPGGAPIHNDGQGGGNNGVGGGDTILCVESSGTSNRSFASFRFSNEKKPQLLPVVLRRSMSMDCSYVAIKVHGGQGDSSSSSSSSSMAVPILPSSSHRLRSFRRLDRALQPAGNDEILPQ